jgi:hypothetical protein
VIHASSVAVSREHRRAKTDRLDTELWTRSSARRASSVLAISFPSNSGSRATLTAMRRASSFVRTFACRASSSLSRE